MVEHTHPESLFASYLVLFNDCSIYCIIHSSLFSIETANLSQPFGNLGLDLIMPGLDI
jgi:hypothetical protein